MYSTVLVYFLCIYLIFFPAYKAVYASISADFPLFATFIPNEVNLALVIEAENETLWRTWSKYSIIPIIFYLLWHIILSFSAFKAILAAILATILKLELIWIGYQAIFK